MTTDKDARIMQRHNDEWHMLFEMVKAENQKLRELCKSIQDECEMAEAFLATMGVTAYGRYNPECKGLMAIKSVLKKSQSKTRYIDLRGTMASLLFPLLVTIIWRLIYYKIIP